MQDPTLLPDMKNAMERYRLLMPDLSRIMQQLNEHDKNVMDEVLEAFSTIFQVTRLVLDDEIQRRKVA